MFFVKILPNTLLLLFGVLFVCAAAGQPVSPRPFYESTNLIKLPRPVRPDVKEHVLKYDVPRSRTIAMTFEHGTLKVAEILSKAEKGSLESQLLLAETYYKGRRGIPIHKVEAYKWAFIATAWGHNPAKYLLHEFDLFMEEKDKAEGKQLAESFLKTHQKPDWKADKGLPFWLTP